ncbi:MAG: hypothetical protein ABJL99_15595 [Aliishimia sp.]
MSYDLMVFDPQIAPRERDAFMVWYKDTVTWSHEKDYSSPEGMSGNLQMFYDSLRQQFPAMNGPDRIDLDAPRPPKTLLQKVFGGGAPPPADIDEATLTDYTCAPHAIYLCFAWSLAEKAYNQTFNTALSCGVGFFNVSAKNGEVLHDAGQFYDFMGL